MTINSQPRPAEASSPPMAEAFRPAKSSASARINRWFERHWLFALNTAWGVFVILPWLAPVLMFLGLTWPGRALYFFYSYFCHQLPERSWFLFGPYFSYTQVQIAAAVGVPLEAISNELIRRQFIGTAELGWKVAWSDRMVAMYTSIFIFGLIYALLRQQGVRLKGIPWWLFVVFLLPMAVDGATHLINDALRLDFRQTNQWAVTLTGGLLPASFYADDMFGSLNSLLRLVSGILFGFGVVAFVWPLLEREFSANNRRYA
jgi:uncharacterized membrane protein